MCGVIIENEHGCMDSILSHVGSTERIKLMQIVKVMYHDDELEKIKKISTGDWTDLRSAEDVDMKQGEWRLIDLGVSMQLPEGYEAILAARSSLFKNTGLLVANGIGVVDHSYCGPEDHWKLSVYATRDTHVSKNDRIAQFRIQRIQPEVFFKTVDKLENPNREGFGSTGVK